MNRAYNFSAGPAVLPVKVLEETAQAVLEYNGLGMSIMEMSHRSKEYDAVFKETQNDALKLMNLSPDEYSVLFLGGGASLQFLMIPMNFLVNKSNYVNTGYWSKKAIKESKWVGNTSIVASSEDTGFDRIPESITPEQDADYIHITTNNTIYGLQWQDIPDFGNIPLFADMSSDIFSVTRDFSKFSLIYAGAQKNIGPAGVTMVVIKKSLLEKTRENIPTMLSYKTHLDAESMYNTPPCLPVYIVGRTFKWIMEQGGLDKIEANNRKKAALLYDFFDANSDFYIPRVKAKKDRSIMNVCWNLPSAELEEKFIAEAKSKKKMTNLKGHRSIGGVRASIYNACPTEWIEELIRFAEQFMKENK